MNSYADVDGVPAGADPWLLTERAARRVGLRPGRVVSDYWAVPFLATMHRVAADCGDAGALALDGRHRRRAARHPRLRRRPGRRWCARVDAGRGARRPRRAPGAAPRRSSSGCSTRTGRRRARCAPAPTIDLDSPANRALAREIAERSIVLLDAGSALPLAGPARRRADRGGRAVRRRPAHVHGLLRLPQPRAAAPPRRRARHRGARPPSTRCAPSSPVSRSCYERGVRSATGTDRSGFAAAVAAARDADALHRARRRPGRPLRPAARRARGATPRTCACPGCRPTCVEELLATGTPVVVVVVSGRPYALGRLRRPRPRRWCRRSCRARRAARRSPASCPDGCSPAGKLPVQIPRHAGRPALHLPAAAARRRRERRHHHRSTPPRCSRSATARSYTDLRASTTCA